MNRSATTAQAWGQVSRDLTPSAATPPAATHSGEVEAFTFDCEGERLLGLLHHAADGAPQEAAATGVVVVVGGPQYRAGSHRQFVHLARALAAAGHPVLRFDVRGMGDSTGTLRNFEQITPDIGAAIDALVQRAPTVRRVVLWGLCDGASAALLYLHERADARIRGVCLLNPWVRSEASLARTHVKHYYTRRLREREFWVKLLRGGVALKALGELGRSIARARGASPGAAGAADAPFQQRMLHGWRGFGGSVLLALSGDDYTAKEFLETCSASPEWQRLLGHPGARREELPRADHTLSARVDREAMDALSLRWLAELPRESLRASHEHRAPDPDDPMTPNIAWLDLPALQLADAEHFTAWEALNTRRADLPFLGADAMLAALRVFGRGDERMLVGSSGGGVAAMLLLQRCGAGRWQTFQPSQIPLGAWVAAPGIEPTHLARSLLHGPLGAALVLSITQIDPLHAQREADGPACTHADYIETGWIDVAGGFDAYWASRGKNLRSNLRKQHNRLAAGSVRCEFVELRATDEMAPALARYGALESAGWKGREGTAIHPDNEQGRFYLALMEDAARRGEAVVHEYRLDGRTVAANLCLERGPVFTILKTTYDESLDRSLSPAFLLHHAQLERIFASSVTNRVEYYGRYMEWHSRWTDSKRVLHHLTHYRWPWVKKVRRLSPPRAREAPDLEAVALRE